MTNYVTSFELGPAGTAIPTSGVAGDGDGFTQGTNGTGATWVSDSTAGALASGSYCAKLTLPGAATVTHRGWGALTWASMHIRAYLYLTGNPNTLWEFASFSGAAIMHRFRITAAGLVGNYHVNSATTTTTTAAIPLNTLVRFEASATASTTGTGSWSLDCYEGHSTSPLTNMSLSGSGLTDAQATFAAGRLGCVLNGPINYTAYFDGYGISDTARLGPLGGLAVPQNLQANAVSSSEIDLTWDAVTGADGYDVERDGSIIEYGWASTTYADTGRSPGTLYTYRVRSVDSG